MPSCTAIDSRAVASPRRSSQLSFLGFGAAPLERLSALMSVTPDPPARARVALAVGEATEAARLQHRQAARAFAPGDAARIRAAGSPLDGSVGTVERRGRTRVLVALSGRSFWVPASWLERLACGAAGPPA